MSQVSQVSQVESDTETDASSDEASSEDAWVFYLIALHDAHNRLAHDGSGRPAFYKGSTNNIRRRLRQHCCVLKRGGARYTTSRVTGRQTERVWKVVCLVRGFTVERHVRQFEAATKQRHQRYRRPRVTTQAWRTIDRLNVPACLKHVLQTLACQPAWCRNGPAVSGLELRLELWQPDLVPDMASFTDAVTAATTVTVCRVVPSTEQRETLGGRVIDDTATESAGGRERPWSLAPWYAPPQASALVEE
jgi:predicted GIY-YIG superfamily endonuclease